MHKISSHSTFVLALRQKNEGNVSRKDGGGNLREIRCVKDGGVRFHSIALPIPS